MADLAKLVDELSALTVMEAADLSKDRCRIPGPPAPGKVPEGFLFYSYSFNSHPYHLFAGF